MAKSEIFISLVLLVPGLEIRLGPIGREFKVRGHVLGAGVTPAQSG